MSWIVRALVIASVSFAALTAHELRAEACGCLSPPVPVDDGSFAVNQQAEQIIFEVEEAHVVAHVLIKYAGSPEQFAWIVPVPAAPELSLSATSVFGMLDQETAPIISVGTRNMCPESEYYCAQHALPTCEAPGVPDPSGGVDAGAAFADAASGPGSPPPVEIIDRQTIGSYDTVVFSAGDTQAAVTWLQQEGFIVNDTMAPFMQPYADAGMLFVASKLIPGADVSEIRPLRMRYPGQTPMIPLRLTAVAAEPHMTITAYVYGQSHYRPQGLPLVNLDESRLSRDIDGRVNYPMVLARSIDDAGGDGFVSEYMGGAPLPDFDQGTGCCSSGFDLCGVAFDGVCSCPGTEFDADDCSQFPDVLAGVALMEELATRHARLTRLTTRLSAEDMTFDPSFEPLPGGGGNGRLFLANQTMRLSTCESDIIEPGRYQAILDRQSCASLYCGTGECVTTDRGAGCACNAGSVARVFTDLDGERSVTCVPDQAPVDLSAGGLVVPSACLGVDCGTGTCVDVGGFPTCRCDAGAGAALDANYPLVAPCRSIQERTFSVGAQDYTAEVADVPVCAPAPPTSCGEYGWLVQRENVDNRGEACSSSMPDPALLVPPPAPTCEDLGLTTPSAGCGCTAGSGAGSGLAAVLVLLGLGVILRRRRRHEPRFCTR